MVGRRVCIAARAALRACGVLALLLASPALAAEVNLPPVDARSEIRASGDAVWREVRDGFEVFYFVGNCRLEQGGRTATSQKMMLWVTDGDAQREIPLRVVSYLEDSVRVDFGASGGVLHDSGWLGTWETLESFLPKAPLYHGSPDAPLAIEDRMVRAVQQSQLPTIQPAQFQLPVQAGPEAIAPGAPTLDPGAAPPAGAVGTALPQEVRGPVSGSGIQLPVGAKSIELMSRSSVVGAQISTENLPATGETLVIATQGITVLIRDTQVTAPELGMIALGDVTISANNLVGWLPLVSDLASGNVAAADIEGELYLEGDIVFRQGDRLIYADRMYYNVNRQYGIVIDAEAITPLPEYGGLARVKADVLQQIGPGDYLAYGAAATTSRMGTPGYWLQSGEVRIREEPEVLIDPLTGLPRPATGRLLASSRNNFVYLQGVPVFYWPVIETDLGEPSFYVNNVKFKNDNVFGNQIYLDFDLYQLLAIDRPLKGTEWTLSTDYLSDRGPAVGTQFAYDRPDFRGIPGPVTGLFDAWYIHDTGLDNLGSDRRALVPEEEDRGRIFWRHRHYLPNDYELWLEAGAISDRNFLEQYFENEWDKDRDQLTGGRVRKYLNNQLLELAVNVRVNEFFTQTNRLPELNHYLLGESLLHDSLTWTAATTVGYLDLETASRPEDPADLATFGLLPWEAEREGLRAITRQELAMPLQAGPVKVVPYVSGEVAHWNETINNQEVTRLLGQTGVRSSLPMWSVDPNVRSALFNVNGIAHKVEWRSEFFYANSDHPLEDLPLYDPLDDDAQEHFRRRLAFNTFGGPPPVPRRFDERFYALRQGIQRNVTTPSFEVADDLVLFDVGLHQRWQTRRGLPGRERIVDLLRLDVDLLLYPNADRDNFGETLGPLRYDFRYHVGDRVTLLSDGYADFFEDGLRSVSAGAEYSRPGLADLYLGVLSLEGPISSTVLTASTDYRLNEKWIVSTGASFDFGDVGDIGESFALTRIGESLLVRVGLNVDHGRDNVSFDFAIEPRFWPGKRLGRLGGQFIPPPGAEGLE